VTKVSLVDMMIANSTGPTPTAIRIVIENDMIDTTKAEGTEAGQPLHHHTIESKVVEQCIMA